MSKSFVTAFYATLSPSRRQLTYAAAGHNPPRLLRGGRVLALDGEGGLPLGIAADESYAEATLALDPGDLVLFYTDGITEALARSDREGAREQFDLRRLDDVLVRCAADSAEACLGRVCEELARFTHGAPPEDDQTLVGLRYVP